MIQPSIVVVFTPLKPNKKKHGDFSLRIQVAARNALRVQFGGYSIFLGGTWIHKVCCLLPKKNGVSVEAFQEEHEEMCLHGVVQPRDDQGPSRKLGSSMGRWHYALRFPWKRVCRDFWLGEKEFLIHILFLCFGMDVFG